jgi:hypothetical protein
MISKSQMENEKKIPEKKKPEKMLMNFLFNIIIPIGILYSRLVSPEYLGPRYGLLLALAFPAGYFIYDLVTRKKTNFISIIGFISIFLVGIIGALDLDNKEEWIAYEKGGKPLLIALAILISLKTRMPLVRKLFYNEEMLDVERIDSILAEKKEESQLNRIFTNSTYMLVASFAFSSALNFTMTKIVMAGSGDFTEKLGTVMVLSKFVVGIPGMIIMMLILWYIFHSMKKLTGLTMEELFAEHLREKTKDK